MFDIMNLVQGIRGSGNPIQFLEARAQDNPIIAKALEMTRGKDDAGIWQVAQNLAKERGTDINAVRQQFGF